MAEPHNGHRNAKAVEINDCDAFHEEREEKKGQFSGMQNLKHEQEVSVEINGTEVVPYSSS
ncbi:hypothetical protein Baya_1693 [Bagarius yarrelli]|uniref:Uncharacterized protein n=1 Tax=Bagarius yarrelli TaxID=175774 RepID=A0A556TLT7_BAGYA|nr:hypothetical protein Baya_1693 [Bagarius yarrelli]